MIDPYRVVLSLLVTEKGTELAEFHDQYMFKVATDSNKIQIRQAVEELFDVRVSSVNVMNCRGKPKRSRGAHMGRRSNWKKAIVTLSEGTIDIL